jgi:predicted ATPase
MVTNIKIKNFKSVVDLSLDLGTFNVFIGENGCGKSNILEAIAFGAAASADKLDYEFLGSRGIRLTNPEFMYSAFSNLKQKKEIDLHVILNKESHFFKIINDANNPSKWSDELKLIRGNLPNSAGGSVGKVNKNSTYFKYLTSILEGEINSQNDSILIKEKISNKKYHTNEKIAEDFLIKSITNFLKNKLVSYPEIDNFIIYSPEQSSLRKLEETNQIYPLGIKGEGLFQYLKTLASESKSKKILDQIKENLVLLDWYEGFDLPEDMMKNEVGLNIRDKYLNQSLKYFDQRSTNEGFLYLLFYSTLFMSKITPSFFAIDNIDASFNPKLCMQITKNLAALAKKNKKQAIVTTQNPAILDGLNLADDNQRLFVVRRNNQGHTVAHRIEHKSERKMKLSELWTNGYIGGLPENF